MTEGKVLTIGHSNHQIEPFLDLLKGARVTAVADVRTQPSSRWSPHFNSAALANSLRSIDIAYVGMGSQLGGRPDHPSLFMGTVANYEAMAGTQSFKEGIRRVVDGSEKHSIALMCSEKEPLDCHRCLLVGRALAKEGVEIAHIHPNGRQESQEQLESRLLGLVHKTDDLFTAREQLLDAAYRSRAAAVAYRTAKPIKG